jgi:phosphate transport system substrate-binding protein
METGMKSAVWARVINMSVLSALALALTGCCAGCSSDKKGLAGAGASFVDPMMSKWAKEYEKAHKIQVNYVSKGSAGGIADMTDKLVDFGCSDGPMTEEELKKAKGINGDVVHIPLVMGAVAIAYNLEEAKDVQLKFTGPVLADIYLHKIKKWNDPAIQKLNPDVKLPDKEIVVVQRSDGSGTTYIFTDYLCKISPDWEKKVGKGTTVTWPTGIGAPKNDGVAGQVKRSAGSIGYLELTYALQNKIAYAALENKDGKLIVPSLASVTAAARESLKDIPEDLRYSITNAPGADSYPISGTTWAITYVNHPRGKAKEVREFLHWCTHDGQAFAEALHYSRLPEELVKRIEKKLELIK